MQGVAQYHYDPDVENPDKLDVPPAEVEVLHLTNDPIAAAKLTTTMNLGSHIPIPIPERELDPPPPAPAPYATPNLANAMSPHATFPDEDECSPQATEEYYQNHLNGNGNGEKKHTTGGVEPIPQGGEVGEPHPGGLAIMDDGESEGWPAGRSKM
ncbi:hypothetical protein HDV00_004698 [Rhizophlyctis rosea]|nr:hypothetical protein HDV00_004698 [Rhizophlyctis rosea]